MVCCGGSGSLGTHNGPAESPQKPKKSMHALVAQMALSANARQSRKMLQDVTVAEVAESIEKEDRTISQVDEAIEKLFQRRGSNPIQMSRVEEEFAR